MTPTPKTKSVPRKTKSADPVNNRLGRTGFDRDYLYTAKGTRAFSGDKKRLTWNSKTGALHVDNSSSKPASYTSPVIKCHFSATEFLPSWNIRLHDSSQGFKILLRVGDDSEKMSPWFFMGEGGGWHADAPIKSEVPAWGKTHIDYLALKKPATCFQYKIEFTQDADNSADHPPIEFHRFYLQYSGQASKPTIKEAASAKGKAVKFKVPYRSQLDVDDEKLRHIVCCPTSVAMVLQYNGIDRPTMDICKDAYDARHKIYGVWPRASQAAFQNGHFAHIDRYRTMQQVRESLEAGQPIIASIRVAEGELRGARYPKSNGHLIVIIGLTKDGKVLVNDPYSVGKNGAEITYEVEDIEKVWLDRGGVAILIESQKSK